MMGENSIYNKHHLVINPAENAPITSEWIQDHQTITSNQENWEATDRLDHKVDSQEKLKASSMTEKHRLNSKNNHSYHTPLNMSPNSNTETDDSSTPRYPRQTFSSAMRQIPNQPSRSSSSYSSVSPGQTPRTSMTTTTSQGNNEGIVHSNASYSNNRSVSAVLLPRTINNHQLNQMFLTPQHRNNKMKSCLTFKEHYLNKGIATAERTQRYRRDFSAPAKMIIPHQGEKENHPDDHQVSNMEKTFDFVTTNPRKPGQSLNENKRIDNNNEDSIYIDDDAKSDHSIDVGGSPESIQLVTPFVRTEQKRIRERRQQLQYSPTFTLGFQERRLERKIALQKEMELFDKIPEHDLLNDDNKKPDSTQGYQLAQKDVLFSPTVREMDKRVHHIIQQSDAGIGELEDRIAKMKIEKQSQEEEILTLKKDNVQLEWTLTEMNNQLKTLKNVHNTLELLLPTQDTKESARPLNKQQISPRKLSAFLKKTEKFRQAYIKQVGQWNELDEFAFFEKEALENLFKQSLIKIEQCKTITKDSGSVDIQAQTENSNESSIGDLSSQLEGLSLENKKLKADAARMESLKVEIQKQVLLLREQDITISSLQRQLEALHEQWKLAQEEHHNMKMEVSQEQKVCRQKTEQLLNTLEELRVERDSIKECEAEVLENLVNMKQQNGMLEKSIEELKRDYHEKIRIQSELILADDTKVKESFAYKELSNKHAQLREKHEQLKQKRRLSTSPIKIASVNHIRLAQLEKENLALRRMLEDQHQPSPIEEQYIDTCEKYEVLARQYRTVAEHTRDALNLLRHTFSSETTNDSFEKAINLLSVLEDHFSI